jgi:hypothetical protein
MRVAEITQPVEHSPAANLKPLDTDGGGTLFEYAAGAALALFFVSCFCSEVHSGLAIKIAGLFSMLTIAYVLVGQGELIIRLIDYHGVLPQPLLKH